MRNRFLRFAFGLVCGFPKGALRKVSSASPHLPFPKWESLGRARFASSREMTIFFKMNRVRKQGFSQQSLASWRER